MSRSAPLCAVAVAIGVSCAGAEPDQVPPPPPPPYVAPSEPPPVVAAPSASASASAKAPPKPEPAQTILGYVDAFDKGQLEQAAQLFADDAEWVSAGSLMGPTSGKANILKGWKELRDVFAIQVSVRRLFVTESVWLAQGVLNGRHVGDFEGMKPTDKAVGVEHVHIGWVEGGKVKKLVSLSNGSGFLTQIGYLEGEAPPVAVPSVQPEIVQSAGDAKNAAAFESMTLASDKADVAAWAANVAPDASMHDRARGISIKGIDAIKKALSAEAKAFSDVKRDTKSFAAGRYVVSYGTITATHTGPFGKVRPTKKQVSMYAVEVVEFQDGKAIAIERYSNPREILHQLGVDEKRGKGVPKKAPPR